MKQNILKAIRHGCLKLLGATSLLLIATPNVLAVIFVDATNFIDVEFSVPSSVNIVAGGNSPIHASLKNTGTVPITFKEYDLTTGYDFFAQGTAIGTGGLLTSDLTGAAWGIGNPAIPFSHDFSHLNNVTINPNDTFVFTLLTVLKNTSSPAFAETFIEVDFGSPFFQGFITDLFDIDIFLSTEYSEGVFQNLSLTQFSFGGNNGGSPGPIPEPSSFTLIGASLLGSVLRRRRAHLRFGRSLSPCFPPDSREKYLPRRNRK